MSHYRGFAQVAEWGARRVDSPLCAKLIAPRSATTGRRLALDPGLAFLRLSRAALKSREAAEIGSVDVNRRAA